MNLLEKIDMFYKMAQKLEAQPLENNAETVEKTQESPKVASIKNRIAKLAKLTKRS